MSTRTPITSPSKPGSVSSSGGASLSTRELIVQRYGGGGSSTSSSSSSGGLGSSKQKAETFETAEQTDTVDNGPVTHSRSSLLGSSSTAVGGKKLHTASSYGAHPGTAHVEDVDSTTRVRPAMAFQQFAGALYVGNRSSGSFEAGPSTLLVPGATTAAGNSAASVRGGSSDEEAVRLKFENPFVKLQRLQEELKEFDSELREAAKQQPKTGAAAGGGQASAASDAAQGIWTNLTANVQQLQGQLDAMLEQPQVKQLLQPHQGSAAAAAAAATHSSSLLPHFDSLFEAYVAELTADPSFQPFPDTATAAPPASTAATGSASSAELAALPRLDERVHALEKLLGASATGATAKQPQIPQLSFSSGAASASSPSNSASSVSASVSVLPAPDLVSALSSLHTQLLQLNPQRMEFVSRACKQILIEQESIALATKQNKEDAAAGGAASTDKKEDGGASAAADASAKPYAAQVSHLYALTSRWDTLALTLPSLISRLSSLHGLHAASATLASRVSTLERQSGAIDAALTAQRDGIEALASTAKENIAALHANFKAMDARIQQINQKIEQLRS